MEIIRSNVYPYEVQLTSGHITRAYRSLDAVTFILSELDNRTDLRPGARGYAIAICTGNGRLLIEWRSERCKQKHYTWVDPQDVTQP